MKKIVKRYGNSLVIVLDAEDQRIHNIEVGDYVDIADMVVTKNKQLNQNTKENENNQ